MDKSKVDKSDLSSAVSGPYVHIEGPQLIQGGQYVEFDASLSNLPFGEKLEDYCIPSSNCTFQWQIDYGNGTGPWQNIGANVPWLGHIEYTANHFYLRLQFSSIHNQDISTLHYVEVSY